MSEASSVGSEVSVPSLAPSLLLPGAVDVSSEGPSPVSLLLCSAGPENNCEMVRIIAAGSLLLSHVSPSSVIVECLLKRRRPCAAFKRGRHPERRTVPD
jgi:hypothetical protein